jgi:hypothetical protein
MTYQEKEITKDHLEKAIRVLDLDEGIRIENKSNMIFVNKSAKRYCVNISTNNKEEFSHFINAEEVLNFLKSNMEQDCKIFSY